MQRRATKLAPLRGQKWRNTHQATVDAVLGAGVRTIRSRGSQFYNKDTWTARAFASSLCEWARLNPGKTPDKYDVEGWVNHANSQHVPGWEKGITIASTPDELPVGLAMALVGGGYHEAWHTEFSRNTPIRMLEVWPRVQRMWALIPYDPSKGRRGWAGLTRPLLEWSNIIEDIRIERTGCQKYPGAPTSMEALQDLILDMEIEGRSASEHKGLPTNDDLSAVMGSFRDIGLGYQTPKQKLALEGYKTRSPAGYDFVTQGPLKTILAKSIALGAADDMDSLWLAMEVVAAISTSASSTAPPPPPKPPKGPPPEGPKPPPPPPKNVDYDPDAEPEEGGGGGPKSLGVTFKVGDRAVLKKGKYKGRTVEVTRAGLPDDKTGKQELEYALVED